MRILRFLVFVLMFVKYKFSKLFQSARLELKRGSFAQYPAVHIRKPGFFDYLLNFSAEVCLSAIFLFVSILSYSLMNGYKDNSAINQFLLNNEQLNPALYTKLALANTTLASHSLISEALAEGSEIQPLQASEALATEAQSGVSEENDTLTARSTDDIQKSVISKIKMYEVKNEDTLDSIAKQFGITPQTIISSNRVSLDQLREGQVITILPTDGLLVQAGPNTTIRDLSRRYRVPTEQIIAYNGLIDELDFDDGQLFILPGGVMPAPETKKKEVSRTTTRSAVVIPANLAVLDDDLFDGSDTTHSFVPGQCTWFVAKHFPVTWGGHAKSWLSNARAAGYETGNLPEVGAVVQTGENSRYGHVALVVEVTDDKIKVRDMNYGRAFRITERWLDKDARTIRGYIYRP
ncbi:MAG TPA: LysM peptidoglycan-binding domain-containing protein [Patescibacteria group bacterium]|nr:LysM peptidoglycan-binding domain-containing protein [Patescibacteria group bacterium]